MVSSDSEDDQNLLMAAGQWAQNEDEMDDEAETSTAQADTASNWDYVKQNKRDKKTSVKQGVKAEATTQPIPVPKNYSLHLTKVPFDATQTTIRYAFIEKNCTVTSVRLVYDTNQKTRERTFRGVAFVDLADESSFDIGLKLHNTAFLGSKRKVNVRPTRSRNELSEIVKKTEERVAMLIARSKEKKRSREEEGDNDGEGDTDAKKKKQLKKNKKKRGKSKERDTTDEPSQSNSTDINTDNKQSKKSRSESKQPTKASRPKATKSNNITADKKSDGTPTKITKKQRAQKAAIIRSKKKK